ncbi:thiamine/thiamine pyrophosphate ABC transporter permease ThiP [Amylibacter ulvae]|uniref:Thiamine/thiamine pyrophosphate ABC transporter permease ThiP n=1 Tax=Paramylibacter ulvae TaxID=1651968 RepID=A0ABQ3D343_9RHOB|nr:thiamine/thiamine pyrophosphate ABC transporter permease ThiP [Amylibacter ulvae]GHA56074.1 thiamine/thiamine pyrophosphate ABC transporter permease ThiP [Amylibacter ulvae]
MANRAQPIRPIHFIAGGGAFALLLVLTFGTVIAVWTRAELGSGLSSSDWAAVRFTLSQAFVSASVSVILAIPVARALARRKFRGRTLMVSFLGAPFILPAIVAVLGIVAVWGRSGWISQAIEPFGFSPLNIYGYFGVVFAHVFFNLPLATRLLLQGWLSIPAEHFRLCAQLDMSPSEISKHLERPMLWSVLPGAFLLVFLLCISSFAVVLALGGGPRATTVELAIYQALRFDFDLSKAAMLAVVQFGLCTSVALASIFIAKPTNFAFGLDRPPERWDGKGAFHVICDCLSLVMLTLFLFLPLLALFIRGLIPIAHLPIKIYAAALNSVVIAVGSAMLAIVMSLALAALIIRIARRRKRVSQIVEGLGFLTLAASPFVIGTGLFIIINPYVSPFAVALPVTALINAAMSLPFALRIILPAMTRAEDHYGTLGDSLGMERWTRFRIAIWPRLKRPIGFAAGLSAALSMGDLGVIALFAPPDIETLPLMMYRLMAAYQLKMASGVALLLISLSLILFWLFDRGGQLEHHTR